MKIHKILLCVLTAILSSLAIAQDTNQPTKTESELIREYPFNFIVDPHIYTANQLAINPRQRDRFSIRHKVCVSLNLKVPENIDLQKNTEWVDTVYKDVSEELKQKVKTTPPGIGSGNSAFLGSPNPAKETYLYADNEEDAKKIAINFIEYYYPIYKNFLQTEVLSSTNTRLEDSEKTLKSLENQLTANNLNLEKWPGQHQSLKEKYILPTDLEIAKKELGNLIAQNNSLQIAAEGLKAKLSNLNLQEKDLQIMTEHLTEELKYMDSETVKEKGGPLLNRIVKSRELLIELNEIRIKTEIEFSEIEAKAKTLKEYCQDYNDYINISVQLPILTKETNDLKNKINATQNEIKNYQGGIDRIKNYTYLKFIEENGISEINIYHKQ